MSGAHTRDGEMYDELLCHLTDKYLACGTLLVWVLQNVEYHPRDLTGNLGRLEVGRVLYQNTHVEVVGTKADLICRTLLLLHLPLSISHEPFVPVAYSRDAERAMRIFKSRWIRTVSKNVRQDPLTDIGLFKFVQPAFEEMGVLLHPRSRSGFDLLVMGTNLPTPWPSGQGVGDIQYPLLFARAFEVYLWLYIRHVE